jgi:hypothetical protein
MRGFVYAAGVVLAIGMICVQVSTGAGPAPVRLLSTGTFHGDELTARSGEVWLGLFPTASGYALRPTTLKVKAVPDPLAESENDRSGKEVTVSDAREPLFLVKAAGRLRPRAVPTAFAGDMSLEAGSPLRLALHGTEYLLIVDGERASEIEQSPSDSGLPQRAKLILGAGAITQQLFAMTSHDEASWQLLWAGDLDGDGKLDLFLDLSTHYNVSTRRLFLSTAAKKGQAVGEVAIFETVGC